MFKKLSIYGLGIILMTQLVSANLLDQILRPFRGINIAQIYSQYYSFIDGIVYTLIFMSLARFVFGRVYRNGDGSPSREANIIAVGVGLALAFAMSIYGARTGFNLGSLNWFAALILFLLLTIFTFNFIRGLFDNVMLAICATIALMSAVLFGVFNPVYLALERYSPLLAATITIAGILAFVCLIIRVFGLIQGTGGGTTPPTGPTPPTPPTEPTPPGNNTITITSPRPETYNADRIPIEFTVSGPDHGSGRAFEAVIRIMDNSGRDAIRPFNDNCNGDRHVASQNIHGLPNGHYRLEVITHVGSTQLAQATVNFEINSTNNNLMNLITTNLGQAINNLLRNYQRYCMIYGTIIQMHHDAHTRIDPTLEPSPTEWATLVQRRNEIADTGRLINEIIRAIHTDPGFATLTTADLNVLATLINNNNNIRRIIIQYEMQARQDYNTHAAPRAPPTLPTP